MAEYIEREALVSICKQIILDDWNNRTAPESWADAYECFIEDIAEQPAADVAEVKHGKWLLEREPDGKPYCFHCSVCDSDFHHIGIKTASDFCPNCGAKMDGKDGTDYA